MHYEINFSSHSHRQNPISSDFESLRSRYKAHATCLIVLSHCWWKPSTYVKHFNWLARIISCWGPIPYITSTFYFTLIQIITSIYNIESMYCEYGLQFHIDSIMSRQTTTLNLCIPNIGLQFSFFGFYILQLETLKCWIHFDGSKLHQTLNHHFGVNKSLQSNCLHHTLLNSNVNTNFTLTQPFTSIYNIVSMSSEYRVAGFIFWSYIIQLQDLKG